MFTLRNSNNVRQTNRKISKLFLNTLSFNIYTKSSKQLYQTIMKMLADFTSDSLE